MKKLKQTFRKITPTRILITYSVLASTAALVFFFGFMQSYRVQQEMVANANTRQLMRSAVLSMTRPLSVAPLKHRAYMPEVSLSLPQGDLTSKLLYNASYQMDKGRKVAYVDFYSKPAVFNASGNYFTDPLCRNVARLSINGQLSSEATPPKATVRLDDNRTVYIYPSTSKVCSQGGNIRGGVSPDKVVDLLRKSQSF